MAMNLGDATHPTRDMRAGVESSLRATHGQLAAVWAQAGTGLSSVHVWRKLGVTVMIGQNDLDGERFTVADARALREFASEQAMGRVSMWSLNRDRRCGVTFAIVGTHSNLCSGVAQKPLEFTKVFTRLTGHARAQARAVTSPDAQPEATTAAVDDPARSPYPIWQPQQAYREGYKVVWHGAVYQARWFTQAQTPDVAPTATGNDPWLLVGPVLRSDRAPEIPKLAPGTHPAWGQRHVYRAGAEVLYRGLPYRASWYTVGDVPGESPADGSPSAWQPLYRIPGEPAAATG
jgi:chitinase